MTFGAVADSQNREKGSVPCSVNPNGFAKGKWVWCQMTG